MSGVAGATFLEVRQLLSEMEGGILGPDDGGGGGHLEIAVVAVVVVVVKRYQTPTVTRKNSLKDWSNMFLWPPQRHMKNQRPPYLQGLEHPASAHLQSRPEFCLPTQHVPGG